MIFQVPSWNPEVIRKPGKTSATSGVVPGQQDWMVPPSHNRQQNHQPAYTVRKLLWNNVRHILLITMDVAITKMSSKGQVVIPASMRTDLPEGEKILIIREGERIILKPLTDIEPALRDDILFAEKTEKAFEEYSKGNFTKKKAGDFFEEMDSW